MAKKINKKNYAKHLPKVGSTLAVAMAMTAALAFPANAEELTDPNLQPQPSDLPSAEGVTGTNPGAPVPEPSEANQHIEGSNNDTLEGNGQTGADNQQTDADNDTIIQGNAGLPDSNLEDPDLDLPVPPDAPNTEDLDGEDYNEVIDGYNKEVDEHNKEVDDYNNKVDGYNQNVDGYNQNADQNYRQELEDFTNAQNEHKDAEQTVKDYEAFLSQLDSMDPNSPEYAAALEKFKAADPKFEKAWADYEAAKEQVQTNRENTLRDYGDFLGQLDALDPSSPEYAAALEQFKAADPGFEKAWADYEAAKNQAETDRENTLKDYSDFLGQLDALDPNSPEYAAALEQFKAADPGFAQAWADYEAARNQAETDRENTLKDYSDFLAQLDALDPNSAEYAAALEQFKAADPGFQKAWADYEAAREKAETDYENTLKDYDNFLSQLDALDPNSSEYTAALEQFKAADPGFRKAWADYEAAKAQAQTDYNNILKEYGEFLGQLNTLDPSSSEYTQALDQFKEADPGFAAEWEKYESAREKADADFTLAQTTYSQQLSTLLSAEKNSQAYNDALAYFDEVNPEFADAWRTYVQETAKHDQLVTENDIYKEVTEYNQSVNADNAEITQKNEALENSMHANNADHIGQVGNINSNLNVSQDVLNVLNSYQSILDLEAQLAEASQALENHSGKNAQLGSDDYAQYLAAVQAYNETVKKYNADVLAYNTAVDTYNAAVKAFNEAQHDTTNSTTGNVTGTGTADWGNINIGKEVNHVDVKYTAAVAKTATTTQNPDGSETTTYSDVLSNYKVTGVYTSKANADAAKKPNAIPSYGVLYLSTRTGKMETLYVQMDNGNNEFGNPSHSGAHLSPKDGVVSFYVTMEDQKTHETYEIDVTMDATDVYPEGTFFEAEANDFLKDFVDSDGNKIPTVTMKDANGKEKTYYDISGQSVFVISALTCDGMTTGYSAENAEYKRVNGSWTWVDKDTGKPTTPVFTLNPNGLDLVMNMQTLVSIHKAGNAQTISGLHYELERTAQAPHIIPEQPGETPAVPDSDYEPTYGEVTLPKFNPTKKTVKAPELNPTKQTVMTPQLNPTLKEVAPPELAGPGEFTRPAPKEPTYAKRLEHIEHLDKLDNKYIIVIPEPEPDIPVYPVVPLVVDNGDDVIIPDAEVPLADAPKTGDLTGIWAALSFLSLAGFGLTRKKGKYEA